MMELDPRKKRILKAVIEDYIQNVEPVGSKSLVERWGLDFSPATLRHEMAALEQMGYLEQPHTSAGRVPSPQGYRLYVNELMHWHKLTMAETEAINASLRLKLHELDRLIADVGQFVSSITRYTAYAIGPQPDGLLFAHFELLMVTAESFVIVAITQAQLVKNKLIRTLFPIQEEDTRLLTVLLNRELTGTDCRKTMHIQFVQWEQAYPSVRPYLPFVSEFIDELYREAGQREVALAGQSHLLAHPEYRDILKARQLLEYLSDRQELSKLSQTGQAGTVQFIIGPEHVAEQLRDASVVMASYQIGEHMRGLVGVVGPTRMDYARLASHLAYFADCLSRQLSGEERNRDGGIP